MKQIILLLFLFTGLGLTQTLAQTSPLPPHRIVMQLTSGDTMVYKGLFKQLNNLKAGWGDSVEIQVVCHGPGMHLLMTAKTPDAAKIRSFQARGIRFVACENTLRERGISKTELLPDLDFVKMGIAEIVMKQEAGWSYIKAGN